MDSDTLKTFITVARQGSFAAAAQIIEIDPSQVSRVIAGLEKELGVRLFQRTTRHMALTEAGALYLSRVDSIVDELADARDQALAVNAAPRGHLRLTASVAFGQVCLVPLLAEFRTTFPDIVLELLLTDDNLDLIANRIDLAIRLAPCINKDLICAKLFDTRYRVCASPGYQSLASPIRTPLDIAQHESVRFTLPDFRTRWLFRDQASTIIEVPVKGGIVLSNALAIRECMLDGLGPALLANWLVDDDIRAGRCLDLFPDHEVTATSFDTAAWLIYPSRRFLPNKVRVVIDFFRRHLTPKWS